MKFIASSKEMGRFDPRAAATPHRCQRYGTELACSGFLLSWWNAAECGGFDLTDLWGVDKDIAYYMLIVFAMPTNCRSYPDTLGYAVQFEAMVQSLATESLIPFSSGSDL